MAGWTIGAQMYKLDLPGVETSNSGSWGARVGLMRGLVRSQVMALAAREAQAAGSPIAFHHGLHGSKGRVAAKPARGRPISTIKACRSRRLGCCVVAETSAAYGDAGRLWVSQERNRLLQAAPHREHQMVVTRGAWKLQPGDEGLTLEGLVELHNCSRDEMLISKVTAEAQLLSNSDTSGITVSAQVQQRSRQGSPRCLQESKDRHDGYWPVCVLQPGEFTAAKVAVRISGQAALLEALQSAVAVIKHWSYNPVGLPSHAPERQHIVLPLDFPAALNQGFADDKWLRQPSGALALPIPTHTLCHLDDPVSLINRYVKHLAKPGDVLAIAETPLAIMQGRFRHPLSVRPGIIACLLCRLFNPVGSLASACSMQALCELLGKMRVVFAAVVGVLARMVGSRGWFYRVAGPQACLVDDITGTMSPYDQFIVLGPHEPQKVADTVETRTGIPCAVVDVNDLTRLKGGDGMLLAASGGADPSMVTNALLSNPQGNSDEQTPLILIRPA